jgi:Ni/Co efflux regulator RcnB
VVTPPHAGGGRAGGGHFEAWGARPGGPAPHWSAGRFPPVMTWNHDRFRLGAYRRPPGFYVRAWGFGDILPRPWFARSYWLLDFLDYDLPYPPPGYTWVRVGPDALMIDEYSGRIVQVVRGIFW